MLNGINTQLLKVFAETSGIPLNPAVLGIGGALTTGAGIYKMMKDARKNNEEAVSEDKNFKTYQNFLPNAKLTSHYTPWIRTLLKSPNPAIATVNLLSGILSVQAKFLETYLTKEATNSGEIHEKKDDDRSIGQKVKGVLHKANFLANPFAQLFTYVFQGLTPSAVAKIYGFDDKKEYKEQMKKAEERSTNLGVNLVYAQLLGMTGSQLLRNKGRDGLMAGIFDMSKMISETLLIIKLKGFGIGKSVRVGEADEKSSFLGKMLRGILNIPGVNAVKNVVKTSAKVGAGIITSPLKVMAGAAQLFDKTKEGFKNFWSGGLRKASQNEEYAAQRAGFVAKKFIDSPGFESTQTSIMKYTRQTAEYFKHYIDIFSKKFDIISNTSKIDKLQDLHYNKYTGELASKKQIANTYREMYRRNLSGSMGTLMKLKAGATSLLKSESPEESLRRENRMMQNELAKATEEYKYSGIGGSIKGVFAGKKKRRQAKADAYQSIGKKMFKPSRDLAGEDDISEYMLGEGRQTKHLTGRQSLIGGLGIGGSSVSLLGGLAAALATVGTGGIGLLAPLLGLAGVAGSAGIGAITDTKFRKTGRGMFKSRMKREGESAFGKQDDKEINIASTKVVSEDILLMREIKDTLTDMYTGTNSIKDLNTTTTTISGSISNLYTASQTISAIVKDIKDTTKNMYTGTSGLSDLNITATNLYNLIDNTINDVKTKFQELVTKLKEIFEDPTPISPSLPNPGNVISILKYYAKKSTEVETEEKKALLDMLDIFTDFKIAEGFATGGPISKVSKVKVPQNKNIDNTIIKARKDEYVLTQEQFQNHNKAIDNLANSGFNNDNVLKVLQDIRDNTKPDPTDTNRIVETIKNSQPDQEEEKLNKIEEASRWNKLIGLTEETKNTLKDKVSYFLRDMWEDAKFKKKKKEESSGIFGLLGGLLASLGGLLAKMFLGNKLFNNPITRFFGKSLWLLVKDFFKLLKHSVEGVWKLVSTPIMKVGGWLIDKFKEHITTPIKNMFGKIGGYISEKFSKYAIEPMKHMFGKIGGFFKGEGTSFLSKMFGKIFGEEGILKGVGKFFKGEGTSFLSKMFGKIFTGEGGFLKNIFGKLFGEEGILKGLGKIFSKFSGGGLLKGIAKRLPGINILFAGWDAFSAWKDAANITGDPKPGFIKKLGAGVAGILSGITFGLVEPKTIYGFISPAINWIGDSVSGIGDWIMNTKPVKMVKEFLGYTENDPNPEKSFLSRAWDKIKEISKDSWNYLCGVPYLGAPLRLINDVWNFLFESKQNAEGEFEPSFVSNMWGKLKEITSDVFGYMKTVPIIGVPFRLLSDAYDYMFGEPDPDKEPTFISKIFDGFKNISKDVFEFMKTVPWFGMPVRILSDVYDFFFNVKPEDKQKTVIERMLDFFKELSPDSILTAILGPTWASVKEIYEKASGTVMDLGQSAWKAVKSAVTGGETAPSSFSAVDKSKFADTAISQAVPSVPSTTTQDKSMWETAKEMGSSALTKAKEIGGTAIDKAKEVGSGLLEKGKSALKSLTSIDTSSYKSLSEEDLKKDKVKVGEFNISTTVYKAIQAASEKYNIPLVYMLAKAAQESGFNPNIKASTSSATGLYQFITGTWDEMWKGTSPQPDRRDPFANADAGARYALKSKKELGSDDPSVLYLGHFMGQGGAKKLLNALKQDPNTPAKNVVGESQMKANASIFKPGSTVQDIYNWSGGVMNKWMKKIGGKELPKMDTSGSPTSFKGESTPMIEKVVDSVKDKVNSIMTPSTPPSTSTETSNPTIPSTPPSTSTETSNPTIPSTPPVVASSTSVPALTQSQMMAQKFPSTQSMTPTTKTPTVPSTPPVVASSTSVPALTQSQMMAQKFPSTQPVTKSDIKSKYKDELSSIGTPKQNRSSQDVAPVGNLNIQKDINELQTNKMTTAEEERKIIVNIPPQQQQSSTLLNVNNSTSGGGQKQSSSQSPIDPSANSLIDRLFSSTIFAFTDSLGKKFVGNELTTSLAY